MHGSACSVRHRPIPFGACSAHMCVCSQGPMEAGARGRIPFPTSWAPLPGNLELGPFFFFLLDTCITETEAVTGHGYQKAVVVTFLRRSLRIWMFGGYTKNWLVPRRTPSRIGYDGSSSLCPFCVYLGQVGAPEKMPSRFPLCGKDIWQPREARWGQEATQVLHAQVSRDPESPLQPPHHRLELRIPKLTPFLLRYPASPFANPGAWITDPNNYFRPWRFATKSAQSRNISWVLARGWANRAPITCFGTAHPGAKNAFRKSCSVGFIFHL